MVYGGRFGYIRTWKHRQVTNVISHKAEQEHG
jgi:hypothetical protein